MRLTKIETFTRGAISVCRVTDSDGRAGFGQLSPYNADIAATVLHRQVAPVAMEADADDPHELAERVRAANMKFPGSYVCRALVGVDTALWDLRGKAAGKRVCELLGGEPAPRAVYGSSMSRRITPEDEAARLRRLRDEHGYGAFKVRVGTPTGRDRDAWPGRSEAVVEQVRRAVGDEVQLMADANSCYSPPRAIEIGRLLEQHRFYWFEEPCPYWELEQTRAVTEALTMNVSGGEQDYDLHQWKRIARDRVVDIAQPDVCYIGGLTRAREAAAIVGRAGLPCVPHSANHSLVTLFTMHLMATIPNAGPFVEFSIEPQKGLHDHYRPHLEVRDGRVAFPDACAGWGVELDEAWLAAAEHQVTTR